MDAEIVREQLHVHGAAIEHQAFQGPAAAERDFGAHRDGVVARGLQGTQKGDECASLAVVQVERRHTGVGQSGVEQDGQLAIVVVGQARHDGRPELAAVTPFAVADGAMAVELGAAGIRGLGRKEPGGHQASQEKGRSHFKLWETISGANVKNGRRYRWSAPSSGMPGSSSNCVEEAGPSVFQSFSAHTTFLSGVTSINCTPICI